MINSPARVKALIAAIQEATEKAVIRLNLDAVEVMSALVLILSAGIHGLRRPDALEFILTAIRRTHANLTPPPTGAEPAFKVTEATEARDADTGADASTDVGLADQVSAAFTTFAQVADDLHAERIGSQALLAASLQLSAMIAVHAAQPAPGSAQREIFMDLCAIIYDETAAGLGAAPRWAPTGPEAQA